MNVSFRHVVAGVLISTSFFLHANSQQFPTLSGRAREIKAKLEKLPMKSHITVNPIKGDAEFGDLVSVESDSFTINDVDQKTNVTFRYQEVLKVKNGYGGYNHVSHRHTDHTKAVVIGLVLAAGLIGLIVAAANSK